MFFFVHNLRREGMATSLKSEVVSRFYTKPKKVPDVVADQRDMSQFVGAYDYYYKEVECNNSNTVNQTSYDNRQLKFYFDGGNIYDQVALRVNWGAYTSGGDTMSQTVPIDRIQYFLNGQELDTIYYYNYVEAFKVSKPKDQRFLKDMYNFTDPITADRGAVTETTPLITPRGSISSFDIKSTSNTIVVPGGLGDLEIRITLKNPYIITGGNGSSSPTLDGITVLAKKRVYRDPNQLDRVISAWKASQVPLIIRDTVEIPPVTVTTDSSGRVSIIQFNITSLGGSNVAYISVAAFPSGDTSKYTSSTRFYWDDANSGIIEGGSVTTIFRTSEGVRLSMLASGNMVDSDTTGYEDNEFIFLPAANSPITEIETWRPIYLDEKTSPKLEIRNITGLAANTTYEFICYVTRLVGWVFK